MIIAIFKNFYYIAVFIILYIFILKVTLIDIKINDDYIYFFTMLLIPFFDKIYEFWKDKIIFKTINYNKGVFFILSLITILCTILFLYWLDIFTVVIIWYLFISIILKLDARITILIALLLFFYSTFFLFVWRYNVSESLLIYSYYLLIVSFLNHFTHKIW